MNIKVELSENETLHWDRDSRLSKEIIDKAYKAATYVLKKSILTESRTIQIVGKSITGEEVLLDELGSDFVDSERIPVTEELLDMLDVASGVA